MGHLQTPWGLGGRSGRAEVYSRTSHYHHYPHLYTLATQLAATCTSLHLKAEADSHSAEKQCDKVNREMQMPRSINHLLIKYLQAKEEADAKRGGDKGQNSDIQASWRMRAGSALEDLRPQKQEQYDRLNIQVGTTLLAQPIERPGREQSPACTC